MCNLITQLYANCLAMRQNENPASDVRQFAHNKVNQTAWTV